jgi:hypothetical protein
MFLVYNHLFVHDITVYIAVAWTKLTGANSLLITSVGGDSEMAKTQEQKDAQSAIRNNIHDINAALSANESSFHSIVLACTQKEMIPTEVSKELFNTTRKSLQERATDLIQYMQTVVGCNAGFLGVFLTILAEEGGPPGKKIAFDIKST